MNAKIVKNNNYYSGSVSKVQKLGSLSNDEQTDTSIAVAYPKYFCIPWSTALGMPSGVK